MKGKRGFTLIEVMVVIAIVTIMVAILAPVFFRARDNARRDYARKHGLPVPTASQSSERRTIRVTDHWDDGDYYRIGGKDYYSGNRAMYIIRHGNGSLYINLRMHGVYEVAVSHAYGGDYYIDDVTKTIEEPSESEDHGYRGDVRSRIRE